MKHDRFEAVNQCIQEAAQQTASVGGLSAPFIERFLRTGDETWDGACSGRFTLAQFTQDEVYTRAAKAALLARSVAEPCRCQQGRDCPLRTGTPYYLVRVVLEGGFDGIANGMRRSDMHDRIRAIHHRGEDVTASDMSNLLGGLANLQAVKAISPPIIDCDAPK